MGATFTRKQVELLMGFRRQFIVFDEDEAGEENSEKLARLLAVLGGKPTIVTTGTSDVGDLKQSDADSLVADLLKK
jgi:DNA primase